VLLAVGAGWAVPLHALALVLAAPLSVVAGRAGSARELRALAGIAVLTLLALSLSARYPGGVRVAGFGFTVVGACPVPASDVLVLADGAVHLRPKSHRVSPHEFSTLARGATVVIVASGWQGAVEVDAATRHAMGGRLLVATNGAALGRYRALRREGTRVALLLHSTC
jgi:hypothetical protein